MHKRFVCGINGTELTNDEKLFLAQEKPWGVIIFTHNATNKQQLKALTDQIRQFAGQTTMIMIDQEGGPVQRLKPPVWKPRPAASSYEYPQTNRAYDDAKDIALELKEVGINVNCMPVLDIPGVGADPVIGQRAYGNDPTVVTHMGLSVAKGLHDGGVLPVLKHIPGHGRATVNSHLKLPVVAASIAQMRQKDFKPFKDATTFRDTRLETPMYNLAMVAHIVYSALDDKPASQSAIVTEMIRNVIGFKGILITDDIMMEALTGTVAERAQACFAGGMDIVLVCNNTLQEAIDVAAVSPLCDRQLSERTNEMLVNTGWI